MMPGIRPQSPRVFHQNCASPLGTAGNRGAPTASGSGQVPAVPWDHMDAPPAQRSPVPWRAIQALKRNSGFHTATDALHVARQYLMDRLKLFHRNDWAGLAETRGQFLTRPF